MHQLRALRPGSKDMPGTLFRAYGGRPRPAPSLHHAGHANRHDDGIEPSCDYVYSALPPTCVRPQYYILVRHCCPQDIKFNVHAHPTLSEVLDELFKGAHVDGGHDANGAAAPAAKQPAVAAA